MLYANNAAAVGFVIYHKGVAVNDFRYLTAAQRLHLDWNDPWYSAFDTRNLRRQFYTPMAGFIYVEPYEVRKTYDGPLTLAKDMMIWNVTPDAVTAREIAYSEDSWPVEEPGPDSNMIATGKFTPLSDFLSEGSVFLPGHHQSTRRMRKVAWG